MLSREAVAGHGAVAVGLLAFVLLLSDRAPFAWTLAGACFTAVVAGDLVRRRRAAERGRWD